MTKNNICRLCREENREVINLGESPPANNFLDGEKTQIDSYPLVLDYCDKCGGFQLRDCLRKEATIFHNASPDKFGKYLKELLKIVETSNSSEKLIYINSWNEWGESAYLGPDERHKYGYLQAIKDLSQDL